MFGIITIQLNAEALSTLRAAQKSTKCSKEYAKITTILGVHDGHSIEALSKLLGRDDSTLYRYIGGYLKEGLSFLDSKYVKKLSHLNQTQESALAKEVRGGVYTTVRAVVDWVYKKWNIKYSCSGNA